MLGCGYEQQSVLTFPSREVEGIYLSSSTVPSFHSGKRYRAEVCLPLVWRFAGVLVLIHLDGCSTPPDGIAKLWSSSVHVGHDTKQRKEEM